MGAEEYIKADRDGWKRRAEIAERQLDAERAAHQRTREELAEARAALRDWRGGGK